MSVLVAVNNTEHGLVALHTGVLEATRRHEPLIVVVLDPVTVLTEALADGLVEFQASGGEVDLRFRKDDDEPADVILDVADETGAGLIVIGTHKRSAEGVYLMGATTQRVLLDASAPVLVVKDVYSEGTPVK